jgi:hypothetical protein
MIRSSAFNKYFYDNYFLAIASETVRFFLPLLLLAAITLLPLGVDILSLKPCLFLLFLLEG